MYIQHSSPNPGASNRLMDTIAKLRKKKARHLVVLSAGSAHSGVQALSLHATGQRWDVLQHQRTTYPQALRQIVETILGGRSPNEGFADLAWLDFRLSRLFVESVGSLVAQLPHSVRTVDLLVLNRLAVWKGLIGEEKIAWDLLAGDPQLLATSFRTPVLTDFIHNDLLAGGPGSLPLQAGDLLLAQRAGDIAVFLNLGVTAQLTIIDTARKALLSSEDIGPATSLINAAAQDAGCDEGFDRDGTAAAVGEADGARLEELVGHGWITRMTEPDFDPSSLLTDPALARLTPPNKLATITALVARAIVTAYRRLYTLDIRPETVWVSGGGANNLMLLECLSAYLSNIAVRSVEELGVPADCRFPVSLGLSVLEHLDGRLAGAGTDTEGRIVPLGRWVLP